jgi:hypothetical protein
MLDVKLVTLEDLSTLQINIKRMRKPLVTLSQNYDSNELEKLALEAGGDAWRSTWALKDIAEFLDIINDYANRIEDDLNVIVARLEKDIDETCGSSLKEMAPKIGVSTYNKDFLQYTRDRCDVAAEGDAEYQCLQSKYADLYKKKDIDACVGALEELLAVAERLCYIQGFNDAMRLILNSK